MLKEGLRGVAVPNGPGTPAWGDGESCPCARAVPCSAVLCCVVLCHAVPLCGVVWCALLVWCAEGAVT